MQAELDAVRSTVEKYPMIPALKSIIGNLRGEAQWETVRPPLLTLADDQKSELLDALHELDFQMPDLID
jgi:4-hydroxy-tetrahydrodipicolinate synthase